MICPHWIVRAPLQVARTSSDTRVIFSPLHFAYLEPLRLNLLEICAKLRSIEGGSFKIFLHFKKSHYIYVWWWYIRVGVRPARGHHMKFFKQKICSRTRYCSNQSYWPLRSIENGREVDLTQFCIYSTKSLTHLRDLHCFLNVPKDISKGHLISYALQWNNKLEITASIIFHIQAIDRMLLLLYVVGDLWACRMQM